MKIGIAGYGFVGQAHELILKNYNDVIIRDPGKKLYGDFNDVNAIIVCVATPQRKDGACEMANVFDVVETAPDVPILIKSTINVEGWKTLRQTYLKKNLTFSPEFLRAAHWQKDALQNKDWYLGGDGTQFWADIFIKALGDINVHINDPAELVAGKALRNSFLALKVAFFNQIYDYCKAHEIDYEAVAKVVGDDNRIGHSHTAVTEERGYGGHCFPKDVSATITSAQKYGTRFSLLEEAKSYNKECKRRGL